jgi:hypothetical protein
MWKYIDGYECEEMNFLTGDLIRLRWSLYLPEIENYILAGSVGMILREDWRRDSVNPYHLVLFSCGKVEATPTRNLIKVQIAE